jgi:hypothetical protein
MEKKETGNSRYWKSIFLAAFFIITIVMISVFAGVEPLSTYKNKAVTYFYTVKAEGLDQHSNLFVGKPPITTLPVAKTNPPAATTKPATSTATVGINRNSGINNNYFLGLVKAPEGVLGGNNCYSEFIVLINNEQAADPTYAELVEFLRSDGTDLYPYQYTVSLPGFFYGTAESKIDLAYIKDIIDGKEQPKDPKVCADFAERLHNEAEQAGIRCAYVSLELTGYTDPYGYGTTSDTSHALTAFQTTDRGLVYIDDTGISGTAGPARCDKIIEVKIGEEYVPYSIFHEAGWSDTWGGMGTVTDIYLTWDGEWIN